MIKKATITIETERLLILRRSGRVVDRWCHRCCAEVKMIGVEEAAAIAGLSQRKLFRLAEAGEIHFIETTQGRSEEHTSELQSQSNLVCRLLLEKKKNNIKHNNTN